jgi:hypothetical protein
MFKEVGEISMWVCGEDLEWIWCSWMWDREDWSCFEQFCGKFEPVIKIEEFI